MGGMVSNGQPCAGTLLARLQPDQRGELSRLGTEQRFGDGVNLVDEGEMSRHVFLLTRGWVKVVGTTASGREALLAVRTVGDLVGELGAVDPGPRIATVRAVGECRAVRIEGPDFVTFLNHRPDVSLAVNASIAAKLRAATRRRVEFSTCSASVRTARILTELSRAYGTPRGTGLEIAVPLTQAELATLAGTAEATLQRVLGDFRREGLIDTGYRRIVVRDEDQLSARAEPPEAPPAG